jgi:uncharacterized protein with HEPN domain
MQRDDSVYLKHIRDAIHKIEDYTKRVSGSSFIKNTLIQDAVIRQIEIIGEATKLNTQRSSLVGSITPSQLKGRDFISLQPKYFPQ